MVWVVGDAGGGDGLEELGLRELSGQSAQVLVNQGTQRDAGGKTKQEVIFISKSDCLKKKNNAHFLPSL